MIIKNSTLRLNLLEAGKLVKEVREIGQKIEDLEKERNKKGIAHQKVKDVIMPLVKTYMSELKEFEDISGVEIVLDKKGKPTQDIEIKIVNRLDEWKKLWAEEVAKQNAEAKAKETKPEEVEK